MAGKEELLAEAVRQFSVLCDWSHHTFKVKDKENLAWDEFAKKSVYPDGRTFYTKKLSHKYK